MAATNVSFGISSLVLEWRIRVSVYLIDTSKQMAFYCRLHVDPVWILLVSCDILKRFNSVRLIKNRHWPTVKCRHFILNAAIMPQKLWIQTRGNNLSPRQQPKFHSLLEEKYIALAPDVSVISKKPEVHPINFSGKKLLKRFPALKFYLHMV